MIRVYVFGTGHLAEATRFAVRVHKAVLYDVVDPSNADVVWFCTDTPVDSEDRPDVKFVERSLNYVLCSVRPGTPVLISSQLPVGTCAAWEKLHPQHHLAVQPENIRKASATSEFLAQPFMVCGTRHPEDIELITTVLEQFTTAVIFMSPESAEMTKHALNTFLAMEIAYANEIAEICEAVGADVGDVFTGLRSDPRVGPGPLRPGGAYRGGTLGRDVRVLSTLPEDPGLHLIEGILRSNYRKLAMEQVWHG